MRLKKTLKELGGFAAALTILGPAGAITVASVVLAATIMGRSGK